MVCLKGNTSHHYIFKILQLVCKITILLQFSDVTILFLTKNKFLQILSYSFVVNHLKISSNMIYSCF